MNLSKVLLFLVSCLFVSCNISSASDSKKKGEVVLLTLEEFKKSIFDYEKNPEKWDYKGSLPAVIDFYADWCGPCRMLSPVFKELATEYAGEVIMYKVDVDKEKELAGLFGVSSIPMLFFIPVDGRPQVIRGALPKGELKKKIDSILLGKEETDK